MSRYGSARVVIGVVIAALVMPGTGVDASEDIAWEWFFNHGRRAVSSELVRVAVRGLESAELVSVGSEVRIAGKGGFQPTPTCGEGSLKMRVVWGIDPVPARATVTQGQFREFDVAPPDSFEVSAIIIPHGGDVVVHCYVYTEDLQGTNPTSGDHWYYAGGGNLRLYEDPRDARWLLSGTEYGKIRNRVPYGLLQRLDRVGTVECPGSQAGMAFVDSALPKVDAQTRCRLAIIADHVAKETETPIGIAAAFICDHARALGQGRGRKAEREGAEETVGQARYNELPPFYGEWVDSSVSPEDALRTRERIRDLVARLEAVTRNQCDGSEAASAFMVSVLPKVDAQTRCRMTILADHLAAERRTGIDAAASIVCEHATILGNAWEAEMVHSGARSLMGQLYGGELPGLYVERMHPPILPGEAPRVREGLWDLSQRIRAVVVGGSCTGSDAARCAVDSVLPMLDARARCVLAIVADYLACETQTPIPTAGAFIRDHSRDLGKGREEDLVERGANVLVRRAEYGLLPGSHMEWMHQSPEPPRPKEPGPLAKLLARISAWLSRGQS